MKSMSLTRNPQTCERPQQHRCLQPLRHGVVQRPHLLGAAQAKAQAAWDAGDSVAAPVAILSRPPSARATNALAEQLCALDSLRGRVRIAVLQGHAAAGYLSESNARMALAVFLRGNDKTSDQLEKILRNPAHVLGVTFRAKARNWQHDEIERLWRKAGVWISDDRRSSPVALLQDTWAVAGTWPWPWRRSSGAVITPSSKS